MERRQLVRGRASRLAEAGALAEPGLSQHSCLGGGFRMLRQRNVCMPWGVPRPPDFTSGAEPVRSGDAKMSESRHRRTDKSDKPVRDNIEAERERNKRREEDEVATSSDDSFPASDPPSFTGVTGRLASRKRKKASAAS